MLVGSLLLAAVAHAELRIPKGFRVIAHRGASAHAPENTLPAFEKALELGAPEIELDVRTSRDGVAFLFHDETLDEKTAGRGPFAKATADALRALEIGSWFDRVHPQPDRRYAGTKLATLRELFERFGSRLFYHVEIKDRDPRTPAAVVDLLREFGLEERAVVTSFSRPTLERVRALHDALSLCLLVARDRELSGAGSLLERQRAAIEAADALPLAQIGIRASDVSREIVAFGKSRGLFVRGWGVKNLRDLRRLLDAGAMGATVDWPDRVLRKMAK